MNYKIKMINGKPVQKLSGSSRLRRAKKNTNTSNVIGLIEREIANHEIALNTNGVITSQAVRESTKKAILRLQAEISRLKKKRNKIERL